MPKNTKQTSARIATLASEVLQNDRASQIAKSLAASALAQRNGEKQTGATSVSRYPVRAHAKHRPPKERCHQEGARHLTQARVITGVQTGVEMKHGPRRPVFA